VHFVIETGFKRSLSVFEGMAPDGFLAIGDLAVLQGREAPQFLYGDSHVATSLVMNVSAVSVAEDWVIGVIRLTHRYATPNDAARPWKAQYVGCCRLGELQNAGDLNWAIAAEVDLNKATRSPKATTLPVVSVPLRSAETRSHLPGVYLPTRGAAAGSGWGIGKPFDVGTAALLNQSLHASYLSVPLATLTGVGDGSCADSSIGAGCFVSLLRASAVAENHVLSAEGWFKLADGGEGGYLLHVGRESADATASCPGTLTTSMQVDACALSTLSVRATPLAGGGTRLEVGHETMGAGLTPSSMSVAFTIASDHHGKWVHIALSRTEHADCFDANVGTCAAGVRRVSYKVYLMGKELIPLGADQGLTSAPLQCLCAPSALGAAGDAGAATVLRLGAGVDHSGAIVGALHGYLDDWRFWNGARGSAQLTGALKTLFRVEREQYTGDPSAPVVTGENAQTESALVAQYDFNVLCPPDTPAGTPCAISEVVSPYPKGAAGQAFKAHVTGDVYTAEPDDTGTMMWESAVASVDASTGFVTFNPSNGPGLYQVTMRVTLAGGVAAIPVDFLVHVLDTTWDPAGDAPRGAAYSLAQATYKDNLYAPVLRVLGAVQPSARACEARVARLAPGEEPHDITALAHPCTLTAYTGSELRLSFDGVDLQDNGNMTQVGFSLGPTPRGMRLSARRADRFGRLDAAWMPCASQVGSHVVCVAAVDDHGATVRAAASNMLCVNIRVQEDPAPEFVFGEGQTQRDKVTLTMGRETTARLVAQDHNCLDEVHIDAHGALPAGARLLEQRRVQGPGVCAGVERHIAWIPSHNQGGWRGKVCFSATDSPAAGCGGAGSHATRHCVEMEVRPCIYVIQNDQQLQEVAALFETTWMQVWSLNQGLLHPDFVMYEKQEVMVGHMYRAGSNELAGGLIKRMGMTEHQFSLLNHGMSAIDVLEYGQEVCVSPNSCTGMRETIPSSIPYLSSGFYARTRGDYYPKPVPP
jgi:hypothetical protein